MSVVPTPHPQVSATTTHSFVMHNRIAFWLCVWRSIGTSESTSYPDFTCPAVVFFEGAYCTLCTKFVQHHTQGM